MSDWLTEIGKVADALSWVTDWDAAAADPHPSHDWDALPFGWHALPAGGDTSSPDWDALLADWQAWSAGCDARDTVSGWGWESKTPATSQECWVEDRHAASSDLPSVTLPVFSQQLAYLDIARATDQLPDRSLSQLVKVVRDWEFVVESNGSELSAPPIEMALAVPSFSTLVELADPHDDVSLTQRSFVQKQRRIRRWLQRWWMRALAALDGGVTPSEIVRVVRDAARRSRRRLRVDMPTAGDRRVPHQLAQLASTIVPHGPPAARLEPAKPC